MDTATVVELSKVASPVEVRVPMDSDAVMMTLVEYRFNKPMVIGAETLTTEETASICQHTHTHTHKCVRQTTVEE
jgi:hypothetical protein